MVYVRAGAGDVGTNVYDLEKDAGAESIKI